MSTLVSLQSTLETICAPMLRANGGPCMQVVSMYYRSVEQFEVLVRGDENDTFPLPALVLSHPVQGQIATLKGASDNTDCRVDSTLNFMALFISNECGNDAARLAAKDVARTLLLKTLAGRNFTAGEAPAGCSLNYINFTREQHLDSDQMTAIAFFFQFTLFQRTGSLT
jgi:hypothetical protein